MKEKDDRRLETIEALLEQKESRGNRLCWIRWNPNSKTGYDIEDAREDVNWMVYEIRRLREENAQLSEFADHIRQTIVEDLEGS